jgi:hypothetical protein
MRYDFRAWRRLRAAEIELCPFFPDRSVIVARGEGQKAEKDFDSNGDNESLTIKVKSMSATGTALGGTHESWMMLLGLVCQIGISS